ncbi:hypothetical protein SAMN04489803_0545 [Pseudomonas chlororaphis]|nr:hypothetical protein SAMN04489803_0545 [Pseudomonas chlororaphis]SUD56102.1 Uncharacterised protein [Pseudomonas chlororaphis]
MTGESSSRHSRPLFFPYTRRLGRRDEALATQAFHGRAGIEREMEKWNRPLLQRCRNERVRGKGRGPQALPVLPDEPNDAKRLLKPAIRPSDWVLRCWPV